MTATSGQNGPHCRHAVVSLELQFRLLLKLTATMTDVLCSILHHLVTHDEAKDVVNKKYAFSLSTAQGRFQLHQGISPGHVRDSCLQLPSLQDMSATVCNSLQNVERERNDDCFLQL